MPNMLPDSPSMHHSTVLAKKKPLMLFTHKGILNTHAYLPKIALHSFARRVSFGLIPLLEVPQPSSQPLQLFSQHVGVHEIPVGVSILPSRQHKAEST